MRTPTLLFLLALVPTYAAAQSPLPSTLPFQGRLTLQAGGNANGVLAMTFRLYNAASGGLVRWTEANPAVSCNTGLLRATLREPCVPS